MVQTVITDSWVGGNSGKIRVDFKAGEDGGVLVFNDAINMLEADWIALGGAGQTAAMELRYTNWKAAVAAASSYERTADDWKQELADKASMVQANIDEREFAKAELLKIAPLTKAEWQAEEALQEQLRLAVVAAKDTATTEAGKL